MRGHYKKSELVHVATFQMFRSSSAVLNPEPASNVIQLEEWGTMSLYDSEQPIVQQTIFHITLSV